MSPQEDPKTSSPLDAEENQNSSQPSFDYRLTENEQQEAKDKFIEFLQFETVSATAAESGAYVECAAWLQTYCENVFDQVFCLPEAPSHSPVVVAKWAGKNSSLPILLLNSHYDVVPVDTEAWSKPAFAGHVQDSKIYGRGTQDMKCVCIQYVEAIRKIKRDKPDFIPQRDVYLTFVPDEEIGGAGMAAFLESKLYHELPGIALALDEGLASTDDSFAVFYGERLPWWVDVTSKGPTGHGSRFIENTAVEQLLELSQKALAFREGQRQLLGMNQHENCAHAVAAKTLGDVTTLNITTLQAGVKAGKSFAYNCVPPTAKASLDIRISPHTDPSDISNMLDQWCQECNKGGQENSLEWSYLKEGNDLSLHATTATDETNPWYGCFVEAIEKGMGIAIKPQVFPAATDSRYLRALGVRALGFSPMRNTEIMLHENDEYIPVSTFLEGIQVFAGLLESLMVFLEE